MDKVNFIDEKWDLLIVLDACRYDYFHSLCNRFFTGSLRKYISPGSCTIDWCMKFFLNYYSDIIYISGNPFINSKISIKGFNAKKCFFKIVDVWNSGWDYNLGTVPPSEINKHFFDMFRKFPDKRYILHYLQPHAPYLSKKYRSKGYPVPDLNTQRLLRGVQEDQRNKILESLIGKLLKRDLRAKLMKKYLKFREVLNLSPFSPMDDVRRHHGVNGLKEAYKENLIIVLHYIASLSNILLTNNFLQKIVITSDHGELLGEKNEFGHICGRKNPLLLEVPWFKVESVVK